MSASLSCAELTNKAPSAIVNVSDRPAGHLRVPGNAPHADSAAIGGTETDRTAPLDLPLE